MAMPKRGNKWPFYIPAVSSLVLTERVKGRGARPDGRPKITMERFTSPSPSVVVYLFIS